MIAVSADSGRPHSPQYRSPGIAGVSHAEHTTGGSASAPPEEDGASSIIAAGDGASSIIAAGSDSLAVTNGTTNGADTDRPHSPQNNAKGGRSALQC